MILGRKVGDNDSISDSETREKNTILEQLFFFLSCFLKTYAAKTAGGEEPILTGNPVTVHKQAGFDLVHCKLLSMDSTV